MPSMRVHELAKEFNLSSKEMLDKLHEMKVPAKSHASMLADAYVAKVRKKLGAELGISQDASEKAAEAAATKKEAEKKKAEEERARREAVEQERARREAERARRAHTERDTPAQEQSEEKPERPSAAAPSPFEKLESQIESEKERVAREAAEARAKARAAAAAKEVAKKQAVEEALRQPEGHKAAPVPSGRRSGGFDSLLSQIESEAKRIEEQKKNAADAPSGRKGRGAASANAGRKGAKKGHGKKGMHFEQIVPELEVQVEQPEDRYAQMAVQAEKLQRDKVLAEARAAVAAATSHEGEGRRKKRKQKREAEARERAEMEALEKGLDPSLVLDDSVVEIPQGATVAKFAELLGVQPNDVIKRLFMLGQVLTLTQSMS